MPALPDFPLLSRLRHWRRLLRRIRQQYQQEHGRPLPLFRPRRFTEKMQWRKLFELDPRFVPLSDKLAVRDFIAARGGADLLMPLLWSGADPAEIPFAALVPPYVVKSTHASGHTAMVLGPPDIEAIRAQARLWLGYCHGSAVCEPGYMPLPRRLVVEALVSGPGDTVALEHKLFCFDGRPGLIQTVVVGRQDGSRAIAYHTPDWVRLDWLVGPFPEHRAPVPRPAQLPRMRELAARLTAGFDHMRVDFYDTAQGLLVGEITVYSWSGMLPFVPDSADVALGASWRLRFPLLRALWTMAWRRHPVA